MSNMRRITVVKDWQASGYRCAIRRVASRGLLRVPMDGVLGEWPCGYVVIPHDHPMAGFEKGYDDESILELDVHGGVTYYERKDDGWWVGFDCNHGEDGYDPKNDDYVQRECESLARQLKDREALGERT